MHFTWDFVPSPGPVALSASFNTDNKWFAVALENGFAVYTSDGAEHQITREVGGGIGSAELLGTTRYLALVGGGKQPKFPQNKVQLWNDAKQIVSASLEFKTTVQRVRISKTHLVVVLLNTVNIYTLENPPKKIGLYETVNNPFGLCGLGKDIVAFPGLTVGQVKIFDLKTKNVSIISAHNTPLQALALSTDGGMVATASELGTLVRLWSSSSCTKITEFRRGVDPATILSMAFSLNNQTLAAASDKATIHIFDIPQSPATEPDPKTHKWGFLSKVPLLPRQFSDIYASATIKFDLGDEPVNGLAPRSATMNAGIPGVPGGAPTRGLLGWLDNEVLIMLSAGQEAKWEKYLVGHDKDGRRAIMREGWKRYME